MADFNGFRNYETWVVSVWATSELDYWQDFARKNANRFVFDGELDREELESAMVDKMRGQAEIFVAQMGMQGFMADLLLASFCRVSWFEIAERIVDGVVESLEVSFSEECE